MFKLIALDLDGTLLNSQKQISNENKKWINKAIEKGTKVVVCSGRICAGAKIYAREINTTAPLIACNGAIIEDIETEEILYSNLLRNRDCQDVVKICHQEGIYFHVYVGDTMYTERLEYSSLHYWKKNMELSDEERVDIRVEEDLTTVIAGCETPATKIVVVSKDRERLWKVRRQIEEIKTVEVTSSNFDNFEVLNQGVNKGEALKYLTGRLNIKREEVIAVGDNENDYSMIKFAGLGVAMKNAETIIKDIADTITDSNDEDGVSTVIKKYVL